MFDTSEKATQSGTLSAVNQKRADLLTDVGRLPGAHGAAVSHLPPPPPGNSKLHTSPAALMCHGAGDKSRLWKQKKCSESSWHPSTPWFLAITAHGAVLDSPRTPLRTLGPSPNQYWVAKRSFWCLGSKTIHIFHPTRSPSSVFVLLSPRWRTLSGPQQGFDSQLPFNEVVHEPEN